MKIAELLRVPYIRGAESVPNEDTGSWVRRFHYGELPDCAVESESTVDGLDRLELVRASRLLELAAAGAEIPLPRPALQSVDVRALFRSARVDVSDGLLDMTVAQAVGNADVLHLAKRLAAAARLGPTTETRGARDETEVS